MTKNRKNQLEITSYMSFDRINIIGTHIIHFNLQVRKVVIFKMPQQIIGNLPFQKPENLTINHKDGGPPRTTTQNEILG